MFMALYIMALAAMLLHAPLSIFDPGAREFVLIIGVVGLWRYGWGLVHFVRSLIYRHRVFPSWRRRAERLQALMEPVPCDDNAGEGEAAPLLDRREVFIVITSFRIRAETTRAVFQAAIEEASRCGRPAVIVASMVELADERLIRELFRRLAPPVHVRLVLVRIAGTGKRDALATALRAVGRQRPEPGSAVVVMDGDALLPRGALARCLPFFDSMPGVAGMTTDEDAIVDGGLLVRHWHRLRFAQRQVLMCSMGLSRRLLTMTGRLSIYRVEIATDPSFIACIRDDEIDHWRLGRIRLLTGEDKSTWSWLLERGLGMLYVPDVRVWTIEHPPGRHFLEASTRLMMRWFGNMLRAGSRAIAMGPARMGLFTWWCLIDQRVSMWTPLIGPLAALFSALTISLDLLYIYALWVMLTRFVQTLMLLTVRGEVSGLYPLLIYYNQVYGALIKTWVMFRPDRQRWTRQEIGPDVAAIAHPVARAMGSAYVHLLAITALVTALAFVTGLLTLPRDFSLPALL